MTDDKVEVLAVPDEGQLVVRMNGKTVVLAFVDHDEPIPVKRHPDGTIGPAIEAEHYVTMLNGRPFRVETRKQITADAQFALRDGHAVTWRRSAG